ncbi:MAG: hypothetical protein ACI4GV_05945 [Acutalibacteraceae bacterium]
MITLTLNAIRVRQLAARFFVFEYFIKVFSLKCGHKADFNKNYERKLTAEALRQLAARFLFWNILFMQDIQPEMWTQS